MTPTQKEFQTLIKENIDLVIEDKKMEHYRSIIQELRAMGISKYRIAKDLGKTWQTVHNWERMVYSPKDSLDPADVNNRKALQLYYIEQLEKRGMLLDLFDKEVNKHKLN